MSWHSVGLFLIWGADHPILFPCVTFGVGVVIAGMIGQVIDWTR